MVDMFLYVLFVGVVFGLVLNVNFSVIMFIVVVIVVFGIEYLCGVYVIYLELFIVILMVGGFVVVLVLMSLD